MTTQSKGQYVIFDFQGSYSWIRTTNGSYLVDPNFEQEFKTVIFQPKGGEAARSG